MPQGVVIVQRARRRPFALLWAGPAWLRSIWLSRRGASDDRRRPSGLSAPVPAVIPRLHSPEPLPKESDEARSSSCTACGDCVPICPSQSLRVKGEGSRPILFQLDVGSCIGCGRCIEICPEAALVATRAPSILVPTPMGRLEPVDLLAPRAAASDAVR